jgi:hypothetical protein
MPYTYSEVARWLRNLNVEADVREAIRAIATPTGSITGTIAYLEADTANWAAGSAVLHIQTDDDDAIPLKVHNGTGVTFQVDRDGSVTLSGIAIGDDGQITFGAVPDVAFEYDTGQTNDAFLLGVCGVSRNFIICEKADMGTDFTHAASTDPHLYIQSSDATTVADFLALYHDQTDAVVASGAGNVKIDPASTICEIDGSLNLATSVNFSGAGQITTGTDADLTFLPTGTGICIFGNAGTPNRLGTPTNDDVFVSGREEVDGAMYCDSTLSVAGVATFNSTGTGAIYNTTTRLSDGKAHLLGSSDDAALLYSTVQTPDTVLLGLSADSLHMVICEKADWGTDFAHAQQTNPTIFLHSADATDVTQWGSFAHDQTDFVITSGKGDVKLAPASGVISVMPAAGKFYINATSTAHTDTNGALDLDVTAGATGVVGFDLSLTSPTAGLGAGETIYGVSVGIAGDGDDNATSNRIAVQIGYTPNGAGGTTYGFYNPDTDFSWGVYNNAQTYCGDNVGIMASSFGTNADGTLALGNSTAPTTSPANMVQLYAADIVAGQSALHLKTEDDGRFFQRRNWICPGRRWRRVRAVFFHKRGRGDPDFKLRKRNHNRKQRYHF